ncbi:hypothetical protein B0H13DRAFT_2317717 [Mycena leptocephala]|nr:hypothetical protein B0H13DRAFT_2317717 [Mycena leptocephala]
MSDPTRCRALEPNGEQCICMRADDTYVDDNKRTRCTNCDHIASAHPQPKPSVSSFVRGFRDAAKIDASSSSSSSVKASPEEAAAETNAGLRNTKKRKPESNAEPASKKAKAKQAKGKAPKTEGDQVKYGKAVMLACGVVDGYLRNSKTPSHQEMQEMRRAKLIEVNAEINRLFPEAMAWLCREYPSEDQLWLGATSHKNAVTLAGDPLPTGVELSDYCKVIGRPAADRVLYVASKHRIAKRHWDWALPESEDLGSDIDTLLSEDIVKTPPKPRPAYKGKTKEVKVKAEPEVAPGCQNENSSGYWYGYLFCGPFILFIIIVGTLKRSMLFIPGSSDEPEPEVSNEQDVVVVSDDEDEESLPLLPWKSTIKSPSPPAASFAPLSPTQDLPTLFYDFTHSLSPLPAGSSASSSMAGPSTSSSIISNFSTWTPAPASSAPAAAPLPSIPVPDTGAEALNLPIPRKASGHRFKTMGKGRGN